MISVISIFSRLFPVHYLENKSRRPNENTSRTAPVRFKIDNLCLLDGTILLQLFPRRVINCRTTYLLARLQSVIDSDSASNLACPCHSVTLYLIEFGIILLSF